MANDLTFTQMATVIAEIAGQATGTKVQAPINTAEFVSVGQTALKCGYDPVLNAISQMVSRTVFANRPYNRKFKGLETSSQRYGAITRKINITDKPIETDERFNLKDGAAIDQQKVNKPDIIQTNFYGANVWQKSYTIFRDQLDNAFTGPDELAEFFAMVVGNASDIVEQTHENTARAAVNNMIGGVIADAAANANRVVHLLTEYNALTGLTLTDTSVYQPENYKAFTQWLFARVSTLSNMLTERSSIYHSAIAGKTVMRHTPKEDQRLFLLAQNNFQISSMALADTFHDNYLKLGSSESVGFWQTITSPDSINVKPVYLNSTTGALTNEDGATNIEQDKVFGLLADRDALGYTVVNEWSAAAPFNAAGGYQNTFMHFTDKYWNDFTENAVVLLLD